MISLKSYPRFQLGYLLLSVILIIAAIYVGFNFWGSIIIELSLWLITSATYPGLEFSPDNRYMRNYYGFLSYKVGRWERLPPIIGVTIKQFSELIHSNSKYNAGIWNSNAHRYQELIIMLSAQNSTNGIIIARFSSKQVKEAIDFAQDIAERFNVPVNNYLQTN